MKYLLVFLMSLTLMTGCSSREEATPEDFKEYNQNRKLGEPEWTTQEEIDLRRNNRTPMGRKTEQAVREQSGTITGIYERTMRAILK